MISHCDIAIIGGGLAGLGVADRLRAVAPDVACHVFEATDRAGGKLTTELIDLGTGRCLVEGGPDAFLARKPWAGELIANLGLSDQLIPINALPHPVAILKQGKPIPLPDGVSLIAPTRLWPFLTSDLLSPIGKMRVAGDFLLPRATAKSDESIGAFVTRRLGREALDWLAEPIAAGIYNADPNLLSLGATFPYLRQIEQSRRSVIRGLRAARKANGNDPRRPVFQSLRDGMQTIADGLVQRVGPALSLNTAVTGLERMPTGEYRLTVANQPPVIARTVVLATPASVAATLLRDTAAQAAEHLSALRAVHAGTISLAYRSADIPRPPSGYGLVIPRREGRPINAVTIATSKFSARAPEGWTLLRVFFGGYRNPETMDCDDDRLRNLVRSELKYLFGVTAPPAFTRIHRWAAGSPQYDVGHLDRIAAIENALPPGIMVTGSAYRGVGIPDVIHQAWITADRIAAAHHQPHAARALASSL